MTEGQMKYFLYIVLTNLIRIPLTTSNGGTADNLSRRLRNKHDVNQYASIFKHPDLHITEASMNSFFDKFLKFIEDHPFVSSTYSHPYSARIDFSADSSSLNDLFNTIGLTYTYDSETKYYSLMFQNNLVLGSFSTYSLILRKLHAETSYLYRLYNTIIPQDKLKLPDISSVPEYQCGAQSYITYNTEDKLLVINGSGLTRGLADIGNTSIYPFSKIGVADTIIINKGISYIGDDAFRRSGLSDSKWDSPYNPHTIVFLHDNSDDLSIQVGAGFPKPKTAVDPKPEYDIYADHDAVLNYNFSSNITVRLHPLSEWEGYNENS